MTAQEARPGGRHCAHERGAFETGQPIVDVPLWPATAPLYELAAWHDGQPAKEWLALFFREWKI